MSGVSKRAGSTDYCAIGSGVGLSDQPRVLSRTARDDGGQSVLLPLRVSVLMCAFYERIDRAIGVMTGREGLASCVANSKVIEEASASVAA
jgi:hypothetical protein